MRTFERADGTLVLELDAAEHATLAALDERWGRYLASTAGDGLGLGRFVPTDTDDLGQPLPGTTWWTGHPAHFDNAIDEIAALADAVADLVDPVKAPRMRPIIEDIKAAKEPADPDNPPDLDDVDIRTRFSDARRTVPDRPTSPPAKRGRPT